LAITRLRHLRVLRGLSLREVSAGTGIQASRIGRHERRREELFPRDRERYGAFYGVDGGTLADGDGLAVRVELSEVQ